MFAISTPRSRYPQECKDQLVEEVLEFYSPIAEAAREYGIAPQPLDNWARKYRKSHGLQDDESGVTAVVKTVREQALEQED